MAARLSAAERSAKSGHAVAMRDGRHDVADHYLIARLNAAGERTRRTHEEIQEYAAELAASAPPLNDDQRARLADILRRA